MPHRSVHHQRGSSLAGALFLVSIFGPMIAVAILWSIAAAAGGNSPDSVGIREGLMTGMIWVLLISGAVIVVEAVLAVLFSGFRRR